MRDSVGSDQSLGPKAWGRGGTGGGAQAKEVTGGDEPCEGWDGVLTVIV